jgi:UDP-2-acetamido-2,6-beta-L-arabino-hexul-4-ose reductase
VSAVSVVTGAYGFLGWHVRVLARARGLPEPRLIGRSDGRPMAAVVDGADRVIHLAGQNRGDPEDVRAGNLEPARALAHAMLTCAAPPKTVVFANSVQAGNGTVYGDAKAEAAQILSEAARQTGSTYVDLSLPRLFGEHGRPWYNSVIATFCRVLSAGGTPRVEHDQELALQHVTDAAAALLGLDEAPAEYETRSVSDLARQLSYFAQVYRTGEFPDLRTRFDVRLFNTYRSHCFPRHYPIGLDRHVDPRGALVEAVKAHGGGGQTYFSSTAPGVVRGQHYHLAKVERFVVLRGEAVIALRRLLHDEVVRFAVSGKDPVAVDMPTMWAHSITNVGNSELITLFWSSDLFDPERPDTYPEAV